MLKEIAENKGISLIDCETNDKYIEAWDVSDLINKSYIIGNNEIVLGIYDDPEKRIASFFHEIGHTLVSQQSIKRVKYDTLKIEKLAWKKGYDIAKFYGIKFSKDIKEWAAEQILTYK